VLIFTQMLHHAGTSSWHGTWRGTCRPSGHWQDGDDQGHGPMSWQVRRRLQLLRSDGLSRSRQDLQRHVSQAATESNVWTIFTARRSYASAILGVVIPSVRQSLHVSVTRVLCH